MHRTFSHARTTHVISSSRTQSRDRTNRDRDGNPVITPNPGYRTPAVHTSRSRTVRRALTLAVVTALSSTLPLIAAPALASADPAGAPATLSTMSGESRPGLAVVHPAASPDEWSPHSPEKWAFRGGQVIQTERGDEPDGPRRPYEYAIVDTGPELGSMHYRASVRIDEPVTRDDRDVVLIFNYRSPTRYNYVHLSQDNTIYPHNGIFRVDDADRERLDDQWDGEKGAPPAIDDRGWHDIRLDHHAPSGRIEVRVDGAREPLMTATDTTFQGGRIGFGSFDNYGRVRDVTAVGTRADSSTGDSHDPVDTSVDHRGPGG